MNSKPQKKRTIRDINKKLARGEAVVMTASELCQAVRAKKKISFEDVDVVTAGTCGLMSGTYAVLSFPFSQVNRFVKAAEVFFNGIQGNPGPCPNERIGIIDVIIQGNRHSRSDRGYGAGHLFRDIVAGKSIEIEVVTDENEIIKKKLTINEIPYAVLHGSRHAFKNYVGFTNPGDTEVPTIFCSKPLPPNLGGVTAAGCGEINPVQKDPELRTIGVGTKLLLNGGQGYVLGLGTRSSIERPCLSVVADMHSMNADLMGGFQTSAGPEVIQTVAVPIPILDEKVFQTAKTLDEEIPLVITDVNGRTALAETTYSKIWVGRASLFVFDPKRCVSYRKNCDDCPPAMLCPSGAFSETKKAINYNICYHCGICAVSCHGNCFSGKLGSVDVEEKKVPIIQRLSDRVTANNATKDLKIKILNNEFQLSEPVEKIKFK